MKKGPLHSLKKWIRALAELPMRGQILCMVGFFVFAMLLTILTVVRAKESDLADTTRLEQIQRGGDVYEEDTSFDPEEEAEVVESYEDSSENVPYEDSGENVSYEGSSENLLDEDWEEPLVALDVIDRNSQVSVESEGIVESSGQSELQADSQEGADTVNLEAEFPYYIKLNRQMNTVTIYGMDANGTYSIPVKAMACSTGLNGATPTGTFQTSTKYTWRQLMGGVYGQYAFRIYKGVLFHSVPYHSQNKGSLYTNSYNKLGQAASHGCVRLSVADAKWLVDNCPSGTTVEIYDSEDPGPLGKPEPIYVDPSDARAGWDPTDPDPSNPWLSGDTAEVE